MARRDQNAGGLIEFFKTIVYAGLIAVGIHTFLFEPFYIPSGSMVPTLLVGDYIIVNKFAYGYSHYSLPFSPDWFSGRIFGSTPKRGTVIVFRPPGDPSEDYIKRVIGLPGDTVQMIGGQLYINSKEVPRVAEGDYVDTSSGAPVVTHAYKESLPGGVVHSIIKVTNGPEDVGGLDPNNTPIYTVPPGDLFVMGDNRDNSEDSRFLDGPVGYVPIENVVGPADIIFFSINLTHPFWEVWEWPFEIRWGRMFKIIH
ncbi:signal peptidase I [Acidocella aminolytica]|jgi:signal peptidase I|uniref:Signal peptidase I n=1 Tax=Acidocella aminolytica 101 = DSM 11237 TaxID=1120923 RepID=A0A0D6PC97_9PROT|nr:signal peptidase I [Acidocella aminolytica]GAN79282.1 signal peptidase I [Acidocella aminolytica 101 = DSM 11237]GBQ39652.1 signal peptidase I [Acidocella aminolytica 101 = DSM 11237]SHE37514.1 signal peptidase I [Acidocella aminolytica 101 = DSM 11237]